MLMVVKCVVMWYCGGGWWGGEGLTGGSDMLTLFEQVLLNSFEMKITAIIIIRRLTIIKNLVVRNVIVYINQ